MLPLDWNYNVVDKCWEATIHGWRAVVARWAGSEEWAAAIEAIDDMHTRYAAQHVFSWVQDAQAWCETELLRRGAISSASEQEG